MKIGIMQPYFFPYLGYWQLIAAVDKYVVYDDVTYIKGGWINRNNILLNGNIHLLTIQLDKSSSNRMINEINVRNDSVEKKKIMRTLEYAYSKAPFYEIISDMIGGIIMQDTTISLMNYNAVLRICDYLHIDTDIILSSQIDKDESKHADDRVIDIVTRLDGTVYINAIGGQELYNRDKFADKGIKLSFLSKNEIIYNQYRQPFIDNLSIIDVLMFNSVEDTRELLEEYKLV